MWYTTLTLSCF